MTAQAIAVERRGGFPIMSSFHALFSLGGLVGAAVAGLAMFEHVPPVAHVLVVSLSMATIVAIAVPSLAVPAPGTASSGGVFVRPPRTLLALGLLALCGLLAEGAMADWSAVYLRDVLGATSGTAALGFAAFSFAMAGGRFAGDGLARRWGAVRVLRTSSTFASVGLALALLLHDTSAAVIGFGAVGLGISNIVPLVFRAAGHASGVPAGTALAAVATLGYFGGLAGPPIIGMLSEALGLSAALGMVSAACAFVAIRAHVASDTAQDVTATPVRFPPGATRR
jgi:fucose permease